MSSGVNASPPAPPASAAAREYIAGPHAGAAAVVAEHARVGDRDAAQVGQAERVGVRLCLAPRLLDRAGADRGDRALLGVLGQRPLDAVDLHARVAGRALDPAGQVVEVAELRAGRGLGVVHQRLLLALVVERAARPDLDPVGGVPRDRALVGVVPGRDPRDQG